MAAVSRAVTSDMVVVRGQAPSTRSVAQQEAADASGFPKHWKYGLHSSLSPLDSFTYRLAVAVPPLPSEIVKGI